MFDCKSSDFRVLFKMKGSFSKIICKIMYNFQTRKLECFNVHFYTMEVLKLPHIQNAKRSRDCSELYWAEDDHH